MPSHNCIIIDDDEVDRLLVAALVKRFPQLHLVGIFSGGEEALTAIRTGEIDVLFLDIDMPELDGLSLRARASDVPVCIFITSYPDYALDAFGIDTLDFLLKPVSMDRFALTVQRIEQYMEVRQKAVLYENLVGGDAILIKEGYGRTTRVGLHEILYLEGLKDYTLVVTEDKKHCVLSSIGNLLKESCFKEFVRIHRSFAVRRDVVKTISHKNVILRNDAVLPVGRTHRENARLLMDR